MEVPQNRCLVENPSGGKIGRPTSDPFHNPFHRLAERHGVVWQLFRVLRLMILMMIDV